MGTFFLSVRKYPPLMHLKLPAFHTRIIYRWFQLFALYRVQCLDD
jgi:hypothetical protein